MIEIDGKKVALGVPGPQRPILDATKQNSDAYPLIPLRRGGSTDEAASAVLLWVWIRIRRGYVDSILYSLVSPLASYISGHTLEVTGGAGI